MKNFTPNINYLENRIEITSKVRPSIFYFPFITTWLLLLSLVVLGLGLAIVRGDTDVRMLLLYGVILLAWFIGAHQWLWFRFGIEKLIVFGGSLEIARSYLFFSRSDIYNLNMIKNLRRCMKTTIGAGALPFKLGAGRILLITSTRLFISQLTSVMKTRIKFSTL